MVKMWTVGYGMVIPQSLGFPSIDNVLTLNPMNREMTIPLYGKISYAFDAQKTEVRLTSTNRRLESECQALQCHTPTMTDGENSHPFMMILGDGIVH